MIWYPIETLPDGKTAMLYLPEDEAHFRPAGMIVGHIERKGWEKHNPPFWVHVALCGGYEMECEITHPTHWAELPDPPA